MADHIFDHEKLDVYRLALEYVAESFRLARDLSGLHRYSRDQWLRAAQSVPLNIAEGNGKRSHRDRSWFFDIARGSALECAAIQDVLAKSGALDVATCDLLKRKLKRIVAMLTRLVTPSDRVSESPAWYDDAVTITITSTSTASLSTSDGQVHSRFGPEQTDAVRAA